MASLLFERKSIQLHLTFKIKNTFGLMETGNLYLFSKKNPKLLGIINPYGLSKHMCANMIPKNHLSFSHVKLLWQDQHKDVWRSGKIATLALCLTCAHSDLNDQNLFHSTIDTPPGVPGVSKNPDNQTPQKVQFGELER